LCSPLISDREDKNTDDKTTEKNSMIRIRASKYGTSDFTVRDGENECHYTVKVYEDNGGHSQIEIAEK